MIQIQELIKHFVLGIVSAILFTTIAMSDITKTKEYNTAFKKVQQEFPEGSFQREVPVALGASIAYLETNGFGFEGAPTAKAANNFHGMHASSNYMKDNPDKFMTTTGGANLRTFNDSKDSIRGFLQLITSDERYKNVVDSSSKVEDMFKGMSPYATREDYTDFLANVYNDNIKPIIETENMLVPKIKPMFQQMNNLK